MTACPSCRWAGGFHNREVHDNLTIDLKHYKEKDWQKPNAERKSTEPAG